MNLYFNTVIQHNYHWSSYVNATSVVYDEIQTQLINRGSINLQTSQRKLWILRLWLSQFMSSSDSLKKTKQQDSLINCIHQ